MIFPEFFMPDENSYAPCPDDTATGKKSRLIALLLSVFVLPGMGQLYLGRKIRGVAIILVVNLLMLIGLFLILKGLSPVIAVKIASGAIGANELLAGMDNITGYGKSLMAGFTVVWCFSVADLIFGRR